MSQKIMKQQRKAAMVILVMSQLGLVLLLLDCLFGQVTFVDVSLLLSMYLVTGLGVTIGFHRYFAHKSFETSPVIEWLLGISGCMAMQGTINFWVSHHRQHHLSSDTKNDPHSPLNIGTRQSRLRAFLHGHMGWTLHTRITNRRRYTKDLKANERVRFIDNHYVWWSVLSLGLPTLLGGLFSLSLAGAMSGFIWGGLGRIALVNHATWLVNSVCHLIGTRPLDTGDHSRNNILVALITFGEGWHNNHHAYPRSARHGLHWWQIDTSYYLIKLMAALGLVWDIKTTKPVITKDAPVLAAEKLVQ